jgi:hypothetical protein
MKLKTLVLAVALLAVLSAIVFWSNRPPAPPPADPRVGQPLADAAALTAATQLRVSDQGKSVLLQRQPDGSWRVASYFGLPADFSKLSSFTSDLTTAKIQRVVTTNPERLARLEFSDTKIEFLDAAGHPLWAVVLGKTADSGGRFVRFGDEPKAYLADLSSSIDAEAKNWADATLLALKPDDIAQIRIPFATGGPITATRAKAGAPWTTDRTPPGKTVKADTLASVLTTLGTLRFSDSSDPADPHAAVARQHARTFVLTAVDGKTTTITLGRKPEEKKPKAPVPPPPPPPPASPDAPAPAPDDTIPAGPVYVAITSSDATAPVNALMAKRAYQIDDYGFTSLPQQPADLFDGPAAPAPASPANPPKP